MGRSRGDRRAPSRGPARAGGGRGDDHQPRHLDFWRSEIPRRLSAFRLCEPRRAAGRHDELSRHRREPDLRQPQRLHPQGRAGAGPHASLRQSADRVGGRAGFGLRSDRGEPRISRGPVLGDLQHAPRGDVLGRRADHGVGRGLHLEHASRGGPALVPHLAARHRGCGGARRTPGEVHLQRGRRDQGSAGTRGIALDPAGALLRRSAVRQVDARSAGRIGAIRRRGRPARAVDPVLQEPRLLGRGAAGECRDAEFRLLRLRVFRRQHRRVRGVQGGRIPAAPGILVEPLGHRL